ncbi:MAG: hypothetical protein AAGA87_03460 [Pseudomonadota bacterium]
MSFFKSTYDCTNPWVTQLTDLGLQDLSFPELPPHPAVDAPVAHDAVFFRSDNTDMGTGGSDGTFYFIDSDSSLILD